MSETRFNDLTDEEKKVVFECLKATAYGPFFSDDLFSTLFGIARSDVLAVISDWPDIDEKCEYAQIAIRQSLLQLTGYPHDCDDIWYDYISVSPERVDEIFYKLKGMKKPEPEKWDGTVRGVFSSNARIFWDKLDAEIQNKHLADVWCPRCCEITTITKFEAGIDIYGNLSMEGLCVRCFKFVEKIIPKNEID